MLLINMRKIDFITRRSTGSPIKPAPGELHVSPQNETYDV